VVELQRPGAALVPPPAAAASAPSPSPPTASVPAPSLPVAPATRTVQVPRLARPPRLSAFLEGTARDGAVVDGFVQRTPVEGARVSQPTTAHLFYDDEHLYAVFVCVDEPGAVRGNMARREAI